NQRVEPLADVLQRSESRLCSGDTIEGVGGVSLNLVASGRSVRRYRLNEGIRLSDSGPTLVERFQRHDERNHALAIDSADLTGSERRVVHLVARHRIRELAGGSPPRHG